MDNTVSIEIEVPNPPDGWEIYGYGKPSPGEKIHDADGWCDVDLNIKYRAHYLLARKKRTLADWANQQELFKALAKMRTWSKEQETVLSFDAGWGDNNGAWIYRSSGSSRGYLGLERPPESLRGTLTLTNGKWELA